MIRTTTNTCNFTNEGRHKSHVKMKAKLKGWPSFIKDDEEREEYIQRKMDGKRYDGRGG